ncbi:MAG: hypothetical protein RIS99_275 [Bacteroidota bacterium]
MGEIQNQENILLIFQKIIEQESKTSTYKFALLRAVIDIITAQSPHIEERATHVAIPVQLVSDKWLFYYWDLIAENYSQIHSGRNLAFEEQLRELQKNHSIQNYWDFKQEFQNPNYSEELKERFVSLAKGLNETILKNPVKYIGTSMGKGYYSLFQVEAGKAIRGNRITGYFDLLLNSPKILLEKSYFEGLKVYGGLLSGSNSIIMNWVDFMQNKSLKGPLKSKKEETIANEDLAVYARRSPLDLLLQSALVERQTASIRNFWSQKMKNGHSVFCTWSGEPIKKIEDLAIDHAIPFSVLFNNDYWNLVPAKNSVNSKKSDKILSKQQLSNSKSRLLSIWKEYLSTTELAPIFLSQCQISLTKDTEISLEKLFDKFLKINEGFVDLRGMESWNFSKEAENIN